MNEKTRILVVDDDPHLLQGMSRILKSGGYETIEAATGIDCLRFTIEQKPDLVLMDVMLPDINGVEVCRRIKSDKTLADSYVVLISSLKTSSDDQSLGLESGADGYIARPVSNRELLARVEALLRLKRAEQSLKQSEERWRFALEGARDGVWDWNPQTNEVFFSRHWKATLGYEDHEIGNTLEEWDKRVHPDDREQCYADLERHFSGETPFYENEHRVLCKDGSYMWILDRGKVMEWAEDGKPLRVIGTHTDITERKQAERRQYLASEIFGILNDTSILTDSIKLILDVIKRETDIDAVGIRLRSGDDFPYFVQSGFSQDFLLTENTLIARDASGPCRDENGNFSLECTCGLVLTGQTAPPNPLFTEGGSIWTNNSLPFLDIPAEQDPRFHPRNNCIHQGYLSVALIPVRVNQEIVGLLQLNDRKKDCFTIDMIHFFEGIGASIGAALLRKRADDVLRQSEDKFRKIFHLNPDGIMITRLVDGRIVSVNDAFKQILGYTEEEVIGKTSIELNVWDNSEDRKKVTEGLKAEGKVDNFEARFRNKDGDIRYGLVSAAIIVLEGVDHILSITKDITERKKTEELLKETNAFLNTLLEAIPVPIFYKDTDGRYTGFNKSFEELFGKTRQDLVGKSVFDLYPLDLAEVYHAKDLELVHNPGVQVYDSQLKDASGDIHDIIFHKSTFCDSKDQVGGLIGVILDVTEQKKAQDDILRLVTELKQVSSEKNSLLEVSRNLLEVHDFSQSARFITDLSKKETGATAGYVALISKDGMENEIVFLDSGGRECTVDPSLPMPIRGLLNEAYRTAEVVYDNNFSKSDWMRFMPEGHVTLDNVMLVPLIINSKSVGVIGLVNKPEGFNDNDVRLIRDFAHFTAAGLRRIRAEEEIRRSLKEKVLLIREIHHRVKNNLQIMVSLLSLQSEHTKDVQSLEMFKETKNRIMSMALVHENLYRAGDFTRIKASDQIGELVGGLLSSYGGLASGISLKTDIEDIYLSIHTAVPFGLIINELISNCLKHAFPENGSGEIIVSLKSIGPNLFELVVKDNGVGIAKDYDFERSKSFGLLLVGLLTQQIHGEIEIGKGEGTEIKIRFGLTVKKRRK